MKLKGRAALVTGAASGIGQATAFRLATEGVRMALVDLDESGLQRTLDAISSAGGRARLLPADVTSWDALSEAFETAEKTFGGLDIVHNNAGVNTGRPRFPDSPRPRWELTLAIDLWA